MRTVLFQRDAETAGRGAVFSPEEARSRRRMMLVVFVLAVGMRGAWGTAMMWRADDPPALEFPDEQQYWRMASSLRSGEGLVDELGFRATRMPLYPGLLALFAGGANGVVAVRVLQWLIGGVGACLFAMLARRRFGPAAGWIAGLLVACDPFLVFFSSLLLTETLFITALGACWLAHDRLLTTLDRGGGLRGWAVAGAAAALMVHSRESSLGLVVALWLFLVIAHRFRPATLKGVALAGLIVGGSLLPWAYRNRQVTGDWCWLTHRSGISLYDGVGPGADGSSDLGDKKAMEAVAGLDEVAWNRYFMDEALRCIKEDPGRIARLAVAKLGRMWNPVPNVAEYQSSAVRFISAAWTIPTFTAALIGVMLLIRNGGREGWRVAFFLLLPALYLSLLHSVFVGSVRYRLGAVPLIEILAAITAAHLIATLGRRSPREANRCLTNPPHPETTPARDDRRGGSSSSP